MAAATPADDGRHGSGRKGTGPKRAPRRQGDDGDRRAGPTRWGGVARRGAAKVTDGGTGPDRAAARERDRAAERGGAEAAGDDGERDGDWIRVGESGTTTTGPPPGPARGRGDGVPFSLPEDDRTRLERAFGDRSRREERRLAAAAEAFRAERFDDARRDLARLARGAPDVPSVRELNGLVLYRMGRWADAVVELQALQALTHDYSQHPVLADCHRALGHHDEVDRLWVELREASPDAALVTEGRIVAAGSAADRGDLVGALRVLGAKGWKLPRRPAEHHLRRAYALADLNERAGNVPVARDLFARLGRAGDGFADAAARADALT